MAIIRKDGLARPSCKCYNYFLTHLEFSNVLILTNSGTPQNFLRPIDPIFKLLRIKQPLSSSFLPSTQDFILGGHKIERRQPVRDSSTFFRESPTFFCASSTLLIYVDISVLLATKARHFLPHRLPSTAHPQLFQ